GEPRRTHEHAGDARVEARAGRPRVLVVDDQPDVRTYLGALLAPRYEVVEAADGHEGIERARAARPALIISDVMMPRRSGFELVAELKGDPATRSIPIILLTARSATETRVAGLLHGADEYVAKPFEPDELLA